MAGGDNALRILILEDVPADAERIEGALRTGGIRFVAKRAANREELVRALAEFEPDIVLSDYRLPDFDGLAALRLAPQERPGLPVIAVTGAMGDEAAVELLKAGADDYVLKDRLSRLPSAVRRVIDEARERRCRIETEAALRQSEEKFRSLVKTSSDWIWETDAKGIYTYASPQVSAILGYAPEEVMGKSRFDFTPTPEAARLVAAFADIASKKMSFSGLRIEGQRKDGRKVVLESNGVPFMAADGSLGGYRGVDRDVTQRETAERTIELLAHTDPLTGLANRAAFLDHLKQNFARARRTGTSFAVLYLDLDHFKDINDTLGHPAGDTLLRAVAERLRQIVRESDVFARFGGDEFAVLQSDILDAADAGTLAAKILQSLSGQFVLNLDRLSITASIGISLCRADLTSPDAMLTQADLALYRAKDEGRNRYCFHSQELDDQVHERITLAEDLRDAIEREELELYYQPEVSLTDGRIVGLEALIRWHHPKRGLLLPASFIAVAERRGIMPALGGWILKSACMQLAAWREAGVIAPIVAINLSASQFKLSDIFESELSRTLNTWKILPEGIEFEVTESTFMEATEEHRIDIKRVRMLGVRFAMDGFGVGHTSFDDLLTYKFTRLKIARRFVAGALTKADDAAIVRAAIAFAKEFGIDVIATGVETKEEADFLRAAGCAIAQGYYFCPPVPADRATELLRQIQIWAEPEMAAPGLHA